MAQSCITRRSIINALNGYQKMTEQQQDQQKKKRRRRRRRGRRGKGPETPENRAEDATQSAALAKRLLGNEDGVVKATPRKTFSVTCDIPVRYQALLEWLAAGTNKTVEEMASRLLVDSLAPKQAQMRDHMAGDAASTVSKERYQQMKGGA